MSREDLPQASNECDRREDVSLEDATSDVEWFRRAISNANTSRSSTEDWLDDSADFNRYSCAAEGVVKKWLALRVKGCSVVDEGYYSLTVFTQNHVDGPFEYTDIMGRGGADIIFWWFSKIILSYSHWNSAQNEWWMSRGKIYSRSYGQRRLVRWCEISSFLLHLYSKNSPKIDQNMHKMSYKMPKKCIEMANISKN